MMEPEIVLCDESDYDPETHASANGTPPIGAARPRLR